MSDEPLPESDPDVQRVTEAVHNLMEHFDSVQIIVTRYDCDSKDTASISRGVGNWSARYGSMVEAVYKMESSFKERL